MTETETAALNRQERHADAVPMSPSDLHRAARSMGYRLVRIGGEVQRKITDTGYAILALLEKGPTTYEDLVAAGIVSNVGGCRVQISFLRRNLPPGHSIVFNRRTKQYCLAAPPPTPARPTDD